MRAVCCRGRCACLSWREPPLLWCSFARLFASFIFIDSLHCFACVCGDVGSISAFPSTLFPLFRRRQCEILRYHAFAAANRLGQVMMLIFYLFFLTFAASARAQAHFRSPSSTQSTFFAFPPCIPCLLVLLRLIHNILLLPL